jgi:hypothetical protein
VPFTPAHLAAASAAAAAASPDYDFAQAPMLVNTCKDGSCKQLVVAGEPQRASHER